MSKTAKWVVGVLTIVFFPFTIAILAFYALFYKIPLFVGYVVEDIIEEFKQKWKSHE